ncbi:Protein of unknown function [Pyronema omphalodes CBS 100304]|uniref:Uncharacterized protein n=1 Tax=Pyronema omphalodes (strain CBS 100304) TaxID=1076935 RepID=U4L009_PYROM|nr:Protein of unknown function [Pyronema omphalodes CBS 100304]
MYHDKCVI